MATDDDAGEDTPTPQWQTYPRSGAESSEAGPQDPDPPEVLLQKAEQRAREAEARAKEAEEKVRRAEAEADREARLARYQGAQEERERDARLRANRKTWERERRAKQRRNRFNRVKQADAEQYRGMARGFRRARIIAGWLVLAAIAVVAGLALIGVDGSSSSRGGRFERPPTPTPQATEQALRPGRSMTVVTGGSRTVYTADGTGRLLAGPASRSNAWQIGMADLRSEELRWNAAVVPGVGVSGYNGGATSLNERYLIEPGRLVQGPETRGWSLLELDTGTVTRTAPVTPSGTERGSDDDTYAALSGAQLIVATRKDYGWPGGCQLYEVAAYPDPASTQTRWTTEIAVQNSLNIATRTESGLLWITSDTPTSSGFGPGPMPDLFDVAIDPATGRPPAWYQPPQDCGEGVVGYLPVDGGHVLRVSEPEGTDSEERWRDRRYQLLDATGRELWTSKKPLTVFDGQIFQLSAPNSYTDYVAADARLLDLRTGKPIWQEAVPGYPIGIAGDQLLLKGYPGITVAARADGAVRSTQAVGRDGSAVTLGDTYYIAASRSGETAVSAYAVADGRPLWTQLYPLDEAQLITSGDQLALVSRTSGTILPLKPLP